MPDDVLANKADTIRRCLRRVTEEYRGEPLRLGDFEDFIRAVGSPPA